MNYLIFAWGATILYGFYNVLGKLTTKYAIKNIWLFSFLYGFCSLLFTLPIALYNHVGLPTAWVNLLLAATFNTLFTVFYALAISKLEVSVIVPLFNFRTAFGVILGSLILKEVIPGIQIVLIVVIIIAGIFSSLDEKLSFKSFFKLPILFGILMALSLALGSIFINKSVADAGYWETNLFIPVISVGLLLFTIPLFRNDIKTVGRKQIGSVAAMSLCLAIGDILANKAYSNNVAISTAIISLPISMIIVIALAVFKPNLLEKHTAKIYAIRFTALVIMILCALKISGVF